MNAQYSFLSGPMRLLTSVTRLGDFYKFLATNCLTKVAQIFWSLLWQILIMPLSCKKCANIVQAIFGRNQPIFYSIIWSHCSLPPSSHLPKVVSVFVFVSFYFLFVGMCVRRCFSIFRRVKRCCYFLYCLAVFASVFCRRRRLRRRQCDQMAALVIQQLAIVNNQICPKDLHKRLTSSRLNISQKLNNLAKNG